MSSSCGAVLHCDSCIQTALLSVYQKYENQFLIPAVLHILKQGLNVSAVHLEALSNIVLFIWVSVLNENKVYLLQ